MILNMVTYDGNGRDRGMVKMNVEFGPRQWSIFEDKQQTWQSIGFGNQGSIEPKGGGAISIMDQQPGKSKQSIVTLLNMPLSDVGIANAGTGKIEAPKDAAFTDGAIFWAFEQSSIRQTMLALMKKNVPMKDMSSDMPAFKTLMGLNTQDLFDNFWEPEKKPDRKVMPVKNTTFTTCNMFLGTMARNLGAALGKPAGAQLVSGPLLLKKVDMDVPGSWVEPVDGNVPQAGDFYSVSHTDKSGWVQKFGHVGIIGDISNGVWTSLDGGQGGYLTAHKDFIKWVDRGKLEPGKFNGWIDIDKYFGQVTKPY